MDGAHPQGEVVLDPHVALFGGLGEHVVVVAAGAVTLDFLVGYLVIDGLRVRHDASLRKG